MPRNRRPRDRDEKRAEIVAAARELFVADGYDDVSLARIARHAGVTATTIYWYFADKDGLLVAVLDSTLTTSLERYAETAALDLAGRLTWVVTELRALSRLVDTVHTRRLVSEPINEWHNNFHALADSFTNAVLPVDTPDAEARATCSIVTFVIEGLLTHDHDVDSTDAIARSLVRTLDLGR